MENKMPGKKKTEVDLPPKGSSVSDAEVGQVNALKAEVAELRKMLLATADAGRMFNYESGKQEKKPLKVKLSVFEEGLIVGWRTVKDELLKHPLTGLTSGETQEYEVEILDAESKHRKVSIHGYPAFSNARYNNRVDAEILSKSEGYDGNVSYSVKLPDGRIIQIDGRFVN